MEHIEVAFVRFPPEDRRRAATDGHSKVWIDDRLNYEGRRCAIEHEMQHIYYGNIDCLNPRAERFVRRATAERLITIEHLLSAGAWATSVYELAEELCVTRGVLMDRINLLSRAEKLFLAAFVTKRMGWDE